MMWLKKCSHVLHLRFVFTCGVAIGMLCTGCKPGDPGIVSEPKATFTVDVEAAQRMTETFTPDPYKALRVKMVEDTIIARGVEDHDVIRVMMTVPRHAYVPEGAVNQAYEDHPVPIGYGQTISQPYIVASMTELLELKPGEKVLEIGTGSGYQASVLAALGYVEVYSIEIVPELAEHAAQTLEELGYDDVFLKEGDGYYGWEEFAPFDAIIVTAAPDHLPNPLVKQLAEGGRLVIPIGPPGWYQTLWKFVKEKDGEVVAYNIGGVTFVPFTGEGVANPEPADVLP
jgi:protein-L-isoaspartate(D-aspartate) O-methyltransferase